jgi:hypothetical protein
MLLLTMLGVFGLLPTLVGIFSMTAYAVARRTREKLWMRLQTDLGSPRGDPAGGPRAS